MASLDVFLPALRRHINGPLEIMMRQSLLESAITFCRESLIVRDSLQVEDAIPGATIALTESTLVKCVKRLRVIDLTGQLSNPDITPLVLDAGVDFTVISANHIAFTKPLGRVHIDVAVEPRRSVSEVPDVLADDYLDVVAAGALNDLFMMPGKPWSDPQRAAFFNAQFVEGYRRAYRDALDNSPVTSFHNPVRKHEFF
ncbi:hypothetical protein Z042_23190 [Chania multitudinisentens RB-25]|uniref:Uncharacterized protein n=1 Tax=Chania multitudinisentens RB-25 TaxID=1441930 RepID=W0LIL3_9GAMM|nr:hypothetical protein [Chania multitudinisentens]AHG22192.1 hypothetical protein Z042_23190 [Chania multitudinisentens RB-25]